MWWPFGKDKLEQRAAQPYTDLVTNYLESQAAGDTTRATTIACVEASAGQYARAFAGAEVQAAPHVKRALTPSVLALVARNLIRYGESVHIIQVMRGEMSLLPAGSFDITGGVNEEEWIYNVHIYGPSGNLSSFIPSASVIHCRYAVDPSQSWRGISPLGFSSTTARLLSSLENTLANESNGPSGYFLPVPIDSSPKADGSGPLDKIRADLVSLKGRTALVETTAAAWNGEPGKAPRKDWASERVGMNPPSTLVTLRSEAAQSIIAALGVPPELFSMAGSAQGSRESWRRFIFGSVEPLCRLVEEELSRKLESPVTLSMEHMFAADIAARSGAFSKMVQAGMDANKAAGISGLAVMEES